MIALSQPHQNLNAALDDILGIRIDYAKSGISDALKPLFEAASGETYTLKEGQSMLYRLREAISLAAGFRSGDKGALIRVVSLKAEAAKCGDVTKAIDSLLFNESGDVPRFDTDGLYGTATSINDVEAELLNELHDHTLEMRVEDALREHLGNRLRAVFSASFGENAGGLFADRLVSTAFTYIIATVLNKRDWRDRCAAALRVYPGAVLLGCKAGEQKSVVDHAACYVLAA